VPGTVQAVYGYQVGDSAKTPFVMMVSNGSMREQYTLGAQKHKNRFRLLVMNFVPGPDAASGWTEQNVEDKLDAIEKAEADVLANNRGKKDNPALAWDYVALEEAFSEIHPATVGGKKYWMEIANVIVGVKDV